MHCEDVWGNGGMQLISSVDGGEWLPLPTVAAGVQSVGGLVGLLGGWALRRSHRVCFCSLQSVVT